MIVFQMWLCFNDKLQSWTLEILKINFINLKLEIGTLKSKFKKELQIQGSEFNFISIFCF